MAEDKQADKAVNNGKLKTVGYCLATIGLFTLVVIAILPAFMNQGGPARMPEGKSNVGAMNRAQQAYYLENNRFASSMEELQLGIKLETDNYSYKTLPQPSVKGVMNVAQTKNEKLNSYVGLVYLTKVGNESTTITQLCESTQPLSKLPEMPSLAKIPANSADIKCPSGFKALR